MTVFLIVVAVLVFEIGLGILVGRCIGRGLE